MRFGADKALVQFNGKPLVKWIIEAISTVVDETILSLSSEPDMSKYVDVLGKEITMAKDVRPSLGPIAGMLSSFKEAEGEYVAVA